MSFTGSVPSGDSLIDGGGAGETMLAVSVKMGDGRTVTLMPFAHVDVKRGAEVVEGEVLGTLAASGDRSSGAPHVHMGLKRGGVYLDPMSLFVAGSSAAGAEAGERAAAKAQAAPGALPAADPAAAPDAVAAPDVSAAPALQPDAATETAGQAAPEESFGTVSSGAYDWQPASDIQLSPFDAVAAVLAGAAEACVGQVQGLVEGLHALAEGTRLPFEVLAGACALMAAAVCALAAYASARWVVPFAKSKLLAGWAWARSRRPWLILAK